MIKFGKTKDGIDVAAQVKSSQIEATVYRCQHNDICSEDGRQRPCMMCKPVNLGVISYYHRNPLKRAAWRVNQLKQRFENFLKR